VGLLHDDPAIAVCRRIRIAGSPGRDWRWFLIMYKFIALYQKPEDLPAFFEHYEKVHAPLARKVPGIRKLVVNRITANAFGGDLPYVLIAEMHFDSKEDFDAAMRSDENRAAGKDAMQFAKGLITGLIAESEGD
jgi:uncharacterized protein (TIGR02118 family)